WLAALGGIRVEMHGWAAVGAVGSIAAAALAALAAYQSRSSAQESNRAATTLATIERDRRHAELCPRFRVSAEPLGPGDYHSIFRLRVLARPMLRSSAGGGDRSPEG